MGTDHSFQCGCNPYTESDIEGFRDFVLNLCQSENIQFIAEEMTSDGLREHSVKSTIFKSEPDKELEELYRVKLHKFFQRSYVPCSSKESACNFWKLHAYV